MKVSGHVSMGTWAIQGSTLYPLSAPSDQLRTVPMQVLPSAPNSELATAFALMHSSPKQKSMGQRRALPEVMRIEIIDWFQESQLAFSLPCMTLVVLLGWLGSDSGNIVIHDIENMVPSSTKA
jgi:hypothetical protein